MKRNINSLMIVLVTVASASAVALERERGGGFFLEPALTVESSTTNVAAADENITNYGLGLRLGGHFSDIFFYGIDGRYSRPKYEATSGESAEADEYDVGATLGAQTPLWGLRLWGTYLIEGSVDPQAAAGVDRRFSGLDGYRVGAGFRIAAVGVNLEYEEARYDDVTINGTVAPGTADLDGSARGLIGSISFPISF